MSGKKIHITQVLNDMITYMLSGTYINMKRQQNCSREKEIVKNTFEKQRNNKTYKHIERQ